MSYLKREEVEGVERRREKRRKKGRRGNETGGKIQDRGILIE